MGVVLHLGQKLVGLGLFFLPVAYSLCNASNLYEFRCFTLPASTTFEAVSGTLHVNPNKLKDFNRELANTKTIQQGTIIRVPYDECLPKVGAWTCYEVQQGDSLTSVATRAESTVRSVDALSAINEDLLWGETTLYKGMQLRTPSAPTQNLPKQKPGCAPDGRSVTCHLVRYTETLEQVAAQYNTTAINVALDNADILGRVNTLAVGMLLRVPLCVFGMSASAGVCNEKPVGACKESESITCHTVANNETLFKLTTMYPMDPYDVCEVNSLGNCSELIVGQILTIPIVSCTPMQGFWDCFQVPTNQPTRATPVWSWQDMQPASSRPDLFCMMNKHLKDCRGPGPYYPRSYAGQHLRIPVLHCYPNMLSYCAYPSSSDIRFPHDWLQDLVMWAYRYGNNLDMYGQGAYLTYDDKKELQVPRGALVLNWGPEIYCGSPPLGCPSDWCNLPCTETPGSHICHKPQRTMSPSYQPLWNDTVYQIAEEFGMSWDSLCEFNGMKNCSCLPSQNVALKIPTF